MAGTYSSKFFIPRSPRSNVSSKSYQIGYDDWLNT